MLDWLIGTSVIAFPFLIPVIVLLIGRIVGYQWRIQRLLVSVAIMFYAVALFGFIAHANTLGLSLQEFFNAYSRLCQPKNGNGLRHRVAGHFKFHFT